MSDTEVTNGSEGSKSSAIAKRIKAWKDRGSKVPDKKEQKGLLDAFKTLLAKRDAAQKALDAANADLTGHAVKLVDAFGDYKLEVDGRKFYPASRGETVFYREEGKQDPDRIIKG